jgi:hypothetical protein
MDAGSPHTVTAQSRKHSGRLLAEIAMMLVRSALWLGFTTIGTALNIWGAVVLLLLIAPGNIWAYVATLFGTAIVGCIGGAITGFGQALALRRWLDGAASLGSFLSTVLASSSALATSTGAGWWMHNVAGDLAGLLVSLVTYGSLFGFVQRPMVDYMAQHSILWVFANAAASVLGATAMLAAFDISGGRHDALQFRYAGIAYAIVTWAAFLWMTRQSRSAMAAQHADETNLAAWRTTSSPGIAAPWPRFETGSTNAPGRGPSYQGDRDKYNLDFAPDELEIHEHRIYSVRRGFRPLDTESAAYEHGAVFADEQGFDGPGDGAVCKKSFVLGEGAMQHEYQHGNSRGLYLQALPCDELALPLLLSSLTVGPGYAGRYPGALDGGCNTSRTRPTLAAGAPRQ